MCAGMPTYIWMCIKLHGSIFKQNRYNDSGTPLYCFCIHNWHRGAPAQHGVSRNAVRRQADARRGFRSSLCPAGPVASLVNLAKKHDVSLVLKIQE